LFPKAYISQTEFVSQLKVRFVFWITILSIAPPKNMASTDPCIDFQPPGDLMLRYNLSAPASEQSPTIPKTFLHALSVREIVFVNEQKAVPLQHHIDRDDARSYHWILYSHSTPPRPIGTVRLVPFPQHPHPEPGSRFEAPSSDTPAEDSSLLFSKSLPENKKDRKTDLHDGIEPIIKLGRLCVVEEERGKGYANLLIQAALTWAREHPGKFDKDDVPKWKGLVCVHARVEAMSTWARNGFELDEGMGTWFEAGIKHVGMFCRLDLK
jgi:predicted GNAT family N-acyltransferase